MREILLSKNKVALVDNDSFDILEQFTWHAEQKKNTCYAATISRVKGDRHKFITTKMHHVVVGTPLLGLTIDHIDGDGLNNQRSNLRIVTRRENNYSLHRPKTSEYPGVTYRKKCRYHPWQSQIEIDGKHIHIGCFKTETEAHIAYMKKVDGLTDAMSKRLEKVLQWRNAE